MTPLTTPARPDQLAWIAPAAQAASLVKDVSELRRILVEDPWRIRVTPAGEACLLARWREHLDYLAVLGLWCSSVRVPALIADLKVVARDHGFGRLLSPLVPEEHLAPYLAAGLRLHKRVIVMRLDARSASRTPIAPSDTVTMRAGLPDDLEAIVRIDEASFDEFWRYDEASLARYASEERVAVAEEDGRVIGYTLAAVRGSEGMLGRIAVDPGSRGRGIGRALLREADSWMVGEGARSITLSTQEYNSASRGLYRSEGFRDLRGMLAAAISEPL